MSKKEVIIGLVIALAIAIFLSPLASSWPDGLEKVAHDIGFAQKSEQGHFFKALLPDYIFPGIKNEKLATSLSGLLGTLIIFAIGFSVALLLKKRKD
jgi:cobalt/nickel transport protein